MKGYSLALAAALLLVLVGDHVIFAQNPPCDPDRDRRNPNLQAAKEAKKAQLRRAGYPERFMKLIDQEECIACVREASDAFHIMIVYKDNAYAPKDPKTGNRWTHISTNWDPESELIAREKTKDGTIKGYYILNTLKRACKCCPEIDDNRLPEDYSDWDEDLQANKNHLIPFDQSNTTGPPPDDLINPPPQWINDPVPNIETFQKPPRKQVSTPCPQCAADALKLNDAYRALDELWDQKISVLNEQSVLENAQAIRRNEISLLYYRQRSALTRTADNDKKIEELEKAEQADQATMRENAAALDAIFTNMGPLAAQIGALEKVLTQCAAACKTATVSETPPLAPAATPVTPAVTPAPAPPRPTAPAPTDGACSECDAVAKAVASEKEAIDYYQQELLALDERIGVIDYALAETARRAKAVPNPYSPEGNADLEAVKKETVRLQLHKDEAIGERTELYVARRHHQAELEKKLKELDTCLKECTTRTARLEPPSLTTGVNTTPSTGVSSIVEPPALPPRDGFAPPSTDPDPGDGYPLIFGKCRTCDKLAADLATVRGQLFEASQTGQTEKAEQLARQYRSIREQLDYCNKQYCRTIADFPEPQPPNCPKCAKAYQDAHMMWADLRRDLGNGAPPESVASSLYKYEYTMRELASCEKQPCVTETDTPIPQPSLPPADSFKPTPLTLDPELVNIFNPDAPRECFGDSCGNDWSVCESNDSCPPVEEDCGIPGTCEKTTPGGGGVAPLVNPADGFTWTPPNIQIEIRIQIKVADLIDPRLYPQYLQQVPGLGSALVIQPAIRQGVQRWFDPLGLLARRMVDQIERWRGSVGPRPLIRTRDLELIDRVSNVQAAGLPKGVHVLLTDQGGSTGKTVVMNILNLTGQPVRLSSKPFAVQPIQQQAQQPVMQAFGRLSQAAPVRLELAAYCVEFLKAPPGPSTLLRLAPPDIQQKYSSMSKVLQSAYRVAKGNALHPDSNPAAYTDAMKQWSIWVVEQNLNEARFTEAFLGHTKKNVEAAKQQWSKQAEDMIRAASPNRWRDIIKILQGAGVPVPR